jgi:predicted N-acetyltransferase YhbS
MRDDIRIELATVDDAEEVLALIKRAFAPVAEQYGDRSLPPLTEPLDSHRARYATHVVLKAMDPGGAIVGCVYGVSDGDTCLIGRLAVEPASQGLGIGRALATLIEAHFPSARRFELFTGHLSSETLHLYGSLGYRELRHERVHDGLTLVYLEKTLGASG